MSDVRRLPVTEDNEGRVTLDDLARQGARRMIAAALEAEVDEYAGSFVDVSRRGREAAGRPQRSRHSAHPTSAHSGRCALLTYRPTSALIGATPRREPIAGVHRSPICIGTTVPEESQPPAPVSARSATGPPVGPERARRQTEHRVLAAFLQALGSRRGAPRPRVGAPAGRNQRSTSTSARGCNAAGAPLCAGGCFRELGTRSGCLQAASHQSTAGCSAERSLKWSGRSGPRIAPERRRSCQTRS